MSTLAAALLPAGLADVLPPAAAFEARTVERLMRHFAGFGYERVKPSLYLPGCPCHPLTLINGLMQLLGIDA